MNEKTNPITTNSNSPRKPECTSQHMFTKQQEETIAQARIRAIKANFPAAEEMRVRVTFVDDVLGMSPNKKDIMREYIASNAPDAPSKEEEIAAVGTDAVEEKEITVFPRNELGELCCYDYQWRGLFKDACGFLSRTSQKGADGKKVASTISGGMKAFKKVIDGNIFVHPRMIPFKLPEGADIHHFSRALRVDTAQGPRECIAKSEVIPAGSTLEFSILVLNSADKAAVEEWMSYGVLHGFGQWRNGGFGTFIWEKVEDWHKVR